MSSRPSVRDLLRSLASQGLFEDVKMEQAARHLADAGADRPMPVTLQALVGAGAWASALCFLAFLGISRIIDKDTMWPAGLVLAAFATALRFRFHHVFITQGSLAIALAGEALVISGIGVQSNAYVSAVAAAAVLAAALYPLYRDPVHRFLLPAVAIGLAVGLPFEQRCPGAVHAIVLALTAAALWLWTRPRLSAELRPLAYALAASIPATLAVFASGFRIETPAWPSTLILAGGMIGTIAWAAGGSLGREPVRLALAGTVLLGALFAPGILAGLLLLVLGYARRERALAGLGALSLAGFLVLFYYDINLDLGTKSALLGASGLALLGAREVLRRRPWARKEAA